MDIKWSQNYCEIAKKPPVLNGRFEIASSISFDGRGHGAKGCGFKHPPPEQQPKTTISKIMTMLAVVKTETQAMLLGRYFRLLQHVLSIQRHS